MYYQKMPSDVGNFCCFIDKKLDLGPKFSIHASSVVRDLWGDWYLSQFIP